MLQHNGTAVHSLAGEYLQESESLVGFERLKQEEVIGVAMGSLYHGEELCSWVGHMTLTVHGPFLAGLESVCVSR